MQPKGSAFYKIILSTGGGLLMLAFEGYGILD